MASYAETLDHNANVRRQPKNTLQGIHLRKADNGGVVAEHRMTRFEGKEPMHSFGAEDGAQLAQHLEKHLGIKMGVKAPEAPAEKDAD